ncbi:MAG: tyrosine-type recombinase/integrase [Acidobacteria bacterium]|nr:tyrosine-type recombinase/integrase [Acidobacteriota bacterium]
MAVEKRVRSDGSTIYLGEYKAADGRRIRFKACQVAAGATKREHKAAMDKARVAASERRVAVENGTAPPGAGLTFKRLVADFLKLYRGRKPGGLRTDYYTRRLAPALEAFGDRDVLTITPEDVAAYRDARLRKGASDSTVRKDVTAVATVFRWALRQRKVADNPARAELVDRPSEPRPDPRPLTDDQMAALLAECPPYLRRIVRWCVHSGMDRAEVLTLGWGAVDEARGVVHAPRSKTGVDRMVYLNDDLRAVLAECKKLRRVSGPDQVFLGPAGQPVTTNQANLSLRRAYHRAKLDSHAPFKRLRHSFGTGLAERGGGAFDVAGMLGHVGTEMAAHYVKIADQRKRDLAESLSRPRLATDGATSDSERGQGGGANR